MGWGDVTVCVCGCVSAGECGPQGWGVEKLAAALLGACAAPHGVVASHLAGQYGAGLPLQVVVELLCNLFDEALEGRLADQQLRGSVSGRAGSACARQRRRACISTRACACARMRSGDADARRICRGCIGRACASARSTGRGRRRQCASGRPTRTSDTCGSPSGPPCRACTGGAFSPGRPPGRCGGLPWWRGWGCGGCGGWSRRST